MYDDELGDRASCCTTGEVACFYALDHKLHGGDGLRIAAGLAEDVRRRQLPTGAFGQPYYVKPGEPGTVDIAEIGAVAGSLYHVHLATGSAAARESLLASARYLLTQVAAEQPGAVYKNPNAAGHDVLNGDVYAAHTWARAYALEPDERFRAKAIDAIAHIANRFGKHEAGWWPYIEHWDGSVMMGNSVGYQGTIIGFAHAVKPLLPAELRERWERVEEEAAATMLREMKIGLNETNEAPWWCRDWSNAWEIYLAFARVADRIAEAAAASRGCWDGVERDLAAVGARRFKPASAQQPDPERSPVTTTFRKAATFAGIYAYVALEQPETAGIAHRE